MAIYHACDGCGARLEPEATRERGFVDKRQYCAPCDEIAAGYYSRLDDLHTKIAATFAAKLGEIEAEFAEHYPGFALPDRPAGKEAA